MNRNGGNQEGFHEWAERLCARLTASHRAGSPEPIGEILQDCPAELLDAVLEELIALDVELRVKAGGTPSEGDYLRDFPDKRAIIARALARESDDSTALHAPAKPDDSDAELPLPSRLGRYEIRRRLGQGSFGVVYLADDPQLNRPVALKVPRAQRFNSTDEVHAFLREARKTSQLKHLGLVTIYDVQLHDGAPFIVQEYINGPSLSQWAAQQRPSFRQIAEVLSAVAQAVGYAHQQGLVHCDLKLANVLMDSAGKPHVADFGLAVQESDQPHMKGQRFGTPAAMAPEQVRGEAHRLDDRTDVWAMGVMMYELLVGRRPFQANSRDELYEDILRYDPRPPRHFDRGVPKELDRICLKCLSKRANDRYSTADDLREDLQAWMAEDPSSAAQKPRLEPAAPALEPPSSDASAPIKIVPKGLRSFDEHDADFFLELLPGPRDRQGLPDSIRFWKQRIEEPDPDAAFSVGLIYGPSGCGKSSLVKAGLLPRLSGSVLPIYVEATANDTEVRLLKELRKHLPQLPPGANLIEVCRELRRTGAGRDRKVLLVIDQFEQWLHAHVDLRSAQLVNALRQCEGGRLQAVVLVRDDFYGSVNQLFQELEERLIEGHNYVLVSRFSPAHAQKVLTAFGLAYGALREPLEPEQEEFLRLAVTELAEEGQVISVRLALFADMMKSRPWVSASLKEVGGVGGLGATFLEETFSAKSAPPAHRAHEQAARGVLQALLPEAGTDIKGSMRPASQLREEAGCGGSVTSYAWLFAGLDDEFTWAETYQPILCAQISWKRVLTSRS